MPIYEFYCKNCGSNIEVIAPMSEAPSNHKCEICKAEMNRVYSGVNVGNKEYGKPLVSHSLGIHPDQIPEHNKLFPDVRVRSDGCPMFDSYKQHDNYLKKIGWEKQPKRGKKVNTGG